MIILVSLISALAAFLFGFIWGTVYVPPVKAVKNEREAARVWIRMASASMTPL